MQTEMKSEIVTDRRQGMIRIGISLVGLLLSGIYLANPSAGFIEFLPDNLPGVGNIDEFLATTIFLACLSRLGINILPSRGTTIDSPKK